MSKFLLINFFPFLLLLIAVYLSKKDPTRYSKKLVFALLGICIIVLALTSVFFFYPLI